MLRVVLIALTFAALILAGCGGPPAEAKLDPARQAALAQFPSGVGRGYPVAHLLGAPPAGGAITRGEPAPDFALVLEDGRHTTLSALKGRPVVLNFWATWCGPCRLEMPELVAAAAGDEPVVIAANVQEARGQVEPFAAEFAMQMPVLLDSEGSLRQAYQVQGLPTTIFIDRNGVIASVFVGPLTPAALAERLAEIE